MDLKSSHHNSPVITDPIAIINKSRLGIHSPSSTKYNSRRSTPSAATTTTTTLNDVRFNGWLDAMKASSPPRKKQTRPFNSHSHHHHLPPSTDHQDYSSWLLDYPSALDSFGKLIENARSKKIAVFLDYDGTLSPIVDDPDCAFMSEAMRGTVRSVANYFPTAIISGRSRDKVYDLVKLTELYYAGSHGMDIIGPASHTLFNNHRNCVKSIDPQGKDITLFQPAREFLPVIDEVYRKLVETTKDIEGAKVENHKFCVSVHYRNVEENNWRGIGQRVHDVLEDYPLLRSTHGRKVLDVRPVIDWNKGKAVEFLLDSLGLSNKDDVLPIFIGDDKTDEDAFKVLRDSTRGYGILVSSCRKQTNAFYSLRDPTEVMKFLQLLVDWKKQEELKHNGEKHSF